MTVSIKIISLFHNHGNQINIFPLKIVRPAHFLVFRPPGKYTFPLRIWFFSVFVNNNLFSTKEICLMRSFYLKAKYPQINSYGTMLKVSRNVTTNSIYKYTEMNFIVREILNNFNEVYCRIRNRCKNEFIHVQISSHHSKPWLHAK